MKSMYLSVLFVAAGMMFMGCPYESKIPLDSADKSKPDKALVGTWEEKGSSSYTWKCQMDGNQYRIEKKDADDANDEPTVYIGWLTEVGGAPFLNVYENDYSSDRKYMIYRMEKKGDGDRIKFRAVTDNITETFTTSDELKSFIKKNMELTFFYNKDDEKTFYKED
jgi:hypothetical protein